MHENDEVPSEALRHVFNDAAVKMQIESGHPSEIGSLYDDMRTAQFTELEGSHAIGLALDEETWCVRQGDAFNSSRCVERARSYVNETTSRPNLVRQTKTKVY